MGILRSINAHYGRDNVGPIPKSEQEHYNQAVALWRAWRANDWSYIQSEGGRLGFDLSDQEVPRANVNVTQMIVDMFATMQVGQLPTIILPDGYTPADAARLDDMLDDNAWDVFLRDEYKNISTESARYFTTFVDSSVTEFPMIRAYAPDVMEGLEWVGHRLVKGTIVHTWVEYEGVLRNEVYWRLYETHTAGLVEFELWYSKEKNGKGKLMALTDYERTSRLSPTVKTPGGRMQLYCIEANPGPRPGMPISDLHGIEWFLLAIPEALGRIHRWFSNSEVIKAGPKELLDEGRARDLSFIAYDSEESARYGGAGGPLQLIEGSFAADRLVPYIYSLIIMALMLKGVAQQSIGLGVSGGNESAESRRTQIQRTLQTMTDKAGRGRQPLRQLLYNMILWDEAAGGHNWSPSVLARAPEVVMNVGLPEDIESIVKRLVDLPDLYTEVEKQRMLHKDWTEKQVADTVTQLLTERKDRSQIASDAFDRTTEANSASNTGPVDGVATAAIFSQQ
jgi:hypothetical protein